MNESIITHVHFWVTGGAFALAFVFGFIGHKTHFCTMGAVADIVNMNDWSRMRMWVLAIAVAMLGVGLLTANGLIDIRRSIYTQPTWFWLSGLVGGLMFGLGMVLASGCGSKTLIRIGEGNLKSLVVFFVMGISALATMRGLFSVWRSYTLDTISVTLPSSASSLPSLAAYAGWMPYPMAAAIIAALIALMLMIWVFGPVAFRRSDRRNDIVLGGIVVGTVVAAAWWLTGSLGYIAEDPETLQERFIATNSGTLESFTFTAPIGYTLELLTRWNDSTQTLTFAIAAVLGMILGSTSHALLTRSFRWEGFRDVEDTANHLVGATLMGVGGVLALGCSVGQGISGLSTLALGSFLTFAAIVGGALLGLKYQLWRLG